MTPTEALHTAARRYCIEHRLVCYERGRGSKSNSAEATAIHARARTIEAILDEVERVTPNGFKSLEDMESWLLFVGEAADDDYTTLRVFRSPENRAAMEAKREQFMAFIRQFAEAGDWAVETLPYQRLISATESLRLWAGLEARWSFSNGWYPMTGEAQPPHTIAFEGETFDKAFGDNRLRCILAAWGVEHVFELSEMRETEAEYEIELASMSPRFCGNEAYWTPLDLSWLIYACHQSTITIGGERLVAAIKDAMPEWEEFSREPSQQVRNETN